MRLFTSLLIIIYSSITTASNCNIKEFDNFYLQFKTDKKFADNHTILPLRLASWEYGIDTDGKDVSSKTVNYVSSSNDIELLSLFLKKNGLTDKITSKNSERTSVLIFEQGTDLQISYHFICHKNQWALYEIEDKSV